MTQILTSLIVSYVVHHSYTSEFQDYTQDIINIFTSIELLELPNNLNDITTLSSHGYMR